MTLKRTLPFLVAVFAAQRCASQPAPPPAAPGAAATAVGSPSARLTVFISDLHFGPPASPGAGPGEIDDFRWPKALRGFLDEVSRLGAGHTDLVILGDLFEWWQHPASPCRSAAPDFGCTEEEMLAVARPVLASHHDELVDLWRFAERDDNRLFVVPGNHDAALLCDPVWNEVVASVGRPAARVVRSGDGRWISADRATMAEHGHQIGPDPSGFKGWPAILASRDGAKLLVRPWGELFVRDFFDGVEKDYPIVDNVIPQSKGVSLLLKNRGIRSDVREVARFFAGDIFHASLSQIGTLSADEDAALEERDHGWNVTNARGLGERLYADALPSGDWFRQKLLDSADASWDPVRADLRATALDETRLPRDAVVSLCDRIGALLKAEPDVPRRGCGNTNFASIVAGLRGDAVLADHLETLYRGDRDLSVFVFGHTHQPSAPAKVKLQSNHVVTVVNDGAFQRLTSPADLSRIAKAHRLTDDAALALPPEDLAPCYSAVLVRTENGRKIVDLSNWRMPEDGTPGKWLDICDASCGAIAAQCKLVP